MRYLSVCSGIEAATVAWHDLGWTPAAFSEIEPFPSAVLAHHYPDVPNVGDMTTLPERILSREVDAPDLLVGGTPCQAFSVAGLRRGLADARGNLSLTYCEIANAIDHVRLADGREPAIIVWENVPGVLSSKDNALGHFLAGLVGESEALQAPRGKWKNAGVVVGPERLVVWRVLDAQFFGVAQRRRRIFLVSVALRHPRAWAIAESFFPLEKGLPRNSPSREQARKVSASGVTRCFAGSSESGVAATLETTSHDYSRADGFNMVAQPVAYGIDGEQNASEELIGTLRSHQSGGYEGARVAQPVAMRESGQGFWMQDEIAGTLRAEGENRPSRPSNVIAQTVAFHPTQDPISSVDGTTHAMGCGSKQGTATVAVAIRTANTGANGHGIAVDVTHTLDQAQGQAVVQPIAFKVRGGVEVDSVGKAAGKGYLGSEETAFTLAATQDQWIGQPVGTDCYNGAITGEVAATIGTPGSSVNASGPTVMQAVGSFKPGQSAAARSIGYEAEVAPALEGGGGGNNKPAVHVAMQVRRLTPTECERLQGFPDGYTNIPWRKKPEAPDGPRYKALGNSMAVPCMKWIGERIRAVTARQEVPK